MHLDRILLLDSLWLFCRHHAPVYKASWLWHHQRCVSQTQTKWATEDYKHNAQADRELCVCVVSAAQLEFVQILVIVVVMMVMVVVITCLLNHYRLSARSLLSRHAPARRRHLPLANVSLTPHSHSCLTFEIISTCNLHNTLLHIWSKVAVCYYYIIKRTFNEACCTELLPQTLH